MGLNIDKSMWTRVMFGDVAAASRERVDPTSGEVDRFIAGEHMDTDDLKIHRSGELDEVDVGPAFHRRFRPGQVLYGSRRTYLRKVAVAEFDGVCANTTFVVESKNRDVLLQEFLPFIMSSEPFHAFAIQESKGSVNPYVNWSDIARYEFDLPPLDEQKRIADLLWAVEKHSRAHADLAACISTAQSTWLERALAPQDGSEWARTAVGNLLISGPTNGKSVTANDEGRGVPTLSISAIRHGRVVGGSAVKHIDVNPEAVADFVIEKDDLLIVRGNGNKQMTGRAGLAVGGLPDGCVFPDLLIRLRFKRDKILPEFAAAQWNSRAAHSTLIRNAKSTNGIWKINGKDVKSHALVVPPLSEQLRIMSTLDHFASAAEANTVERSGLASFTRTCLDSIFGGQ